MRRVRADGFAAWRREARALLAAGVEPRVVAWDGDDGAQGSLLGGHLAIGPEAAPTGPATARVPRRFLELAETVACHAGSERWGLLYAALWRVARGEPRLLEVATDPLVHRLRRMEKAVTRETHKLKAFVRFRPVRTEGGERWVAWHEPAHDVLARAAPFFAERFASMRFSILTPGASLHHDGGALRLGPGASRADAPAGDPLEALWRTYYASTFNPSRLRTRAMAAEMPRRFWRNLPEAAEIAPLVAAGPARVRRMLEGTADGRELPRRSRTPDARGE